MTTEPGMVLWVDLGRRLPVGREQAGPRPVLVAGDPVRLGLPRFPLVVVVPVTSYLGQNWVRASPRLYPTLNAGAGNLPRPSLILLDQVQAIELRRIRGYLGRLSETEYAPVREGLRVMLAG